MLGIKILYANGKEEDLGRKPITAEKLREVVATGRDPRNTWLEWVAIEGHPNKYEAGVPCMVVNESGLNHALPINNTATKLYPGRDYSPIVGDVVVIEHELSDVEG